MAIDLGGLTQELDALRDELRANTSEEDFRHFKKIEGWGRYGSLLGWALAWLAPNPISAYLIGQGTFARWAIVGHHILHRGLDKVPNIPHHYTSKGFAKGWRRVVDWLDWIHPAAWNYEHNSLHHYKLGESFDPDQPELNLSFLRGSSLPLFLRYLIVFFFMFTWKFLYYAPNTVGEHHLHESKVKKGDGDRMDLLDPKVWLPLSNPGRKIWWRSFLPYFTVRFILLPLPFLFIGPWAYFSVLMNLVFAELWTNFHGFITIVPNHAGDDIYRFTSPVNGRQDFYLRQIVGSVNYRCGGDLNDFLHGWLNYQIEHHLWPDLSPLQYQRAQPKVKAICEKYGVPYVQESIFKRWWKLIDIMVGRSDMPVWEEQQNYAVQS